MRWLPFVVGFALWLPGPRTMADDGGGAGGGAGGAGIVHLSERTVVEVGRARVIAFRVDDAAAGRSVSAVVARPELLEVIGEAAVAASGDLGYVRVLGRAPGTTTFSVGDADMQVQIVPPRVPQADDHFAPRIIGPVDGAVVWGTVAVGVEVREPLRQSPRRLELLVGEQRLTPIEDTGETYLPDHFARFELAAAALPAGPVEILPVAIDDAGTVLHGAPVALDVMHPSSEDVTAGEAETTYELERPARFANDRVNIGVDRLASGGRFFSNFGADPAFCFPVHVERAGWYQVMLVAGGTRAGGALPTVGVVIDGADRSTTNGRLLADGRWHRFAVGVPVRLEPGDRVITPYFANDFVAPGVDRNLVLDRIEVARVADADSVAADPAADDDAAMMMMEGAMMAAAGDARGAARTPDDPYGLAGHPLRIGFTRPFDGETLPGLIEISGRVWWPGDARAPEVTLLVNDRPVARQRTGAPRFWIDPGHFVGGANTVRLAATLDGGATAQTPVQRVAYPAEAAAAVGPLRRHVRFSVHDANWGEGLDGALSAEHAPGERVAADLSQVEVVALRVPAEMTGGYKVFLECMADGARAPDAAPPRVTVALRCGEGEGGDAIETGASPVRRHWGLAPVGSVDLPDGPCELLVAAGKNEEARDVVRLESVIFVQDPLIPDRAAPIVAIDYPPADHPVHLCDALVARASDNASLAHAELVVDGRRTGCATRLNLRGGDIVMPLVVRDLSPGRHTVGLFISDIEGNTVRSEERAIMVLAAPPDDPGPYLRAVHMLDRFGYGPSPRDLAAILVAGEREWLEGQLRTSFDHPAEAAALGGAIAAFPELSESDVTGRTIAHLLLTRAPARARFVMWAENHFSTWIRKTGAPRKWNEHVAFSRLGAAPFEHLLLASAESPAMLEYLDQVRSFAESANENYAREIMELHTLGVDGGYTQADVTQLAQMLTGWTASFEGDGRSGGPGAQRFHHRFDGMLNDPEPYTLLGVELAVGETGPYDRARLAIEMLAAHPSTARYIAGKLAEHYVSVPAPPALVDDLQAVFLETNGDCAALLLAIAAHPAFWDVSAAERIASPLDHAIRLARATERLRPREIATYLERSGHGLFARTSPDGYPEDDRLYTSSKALVQRWRLAHDMRWDLAALVPGRWQNDRTVDEAMWAQRVVDVLAVRMTGRLLEAPSNEAALDLLMHASGQRHERMASIAAFMGQLPEVNLR